MMLNPLEHMRRGAVWKPVKMLVMIVDRCFMRGRERYIG